LLNYIIKNRANAQLLERILNEVIIGKMYLEAERVEIAEMLVKYYRKQIKLCGKEFEGEMDSQLSNKCYNIYQSIPVETFTGISEESKNDFLFETFRMGFHLKKYTEAELVLRKIRKVSLNAENKLVYLNFKVLLECQREKFIEATKIYQEIL